MHLFPSWLLDLLPKGEDDFITWSDLFTYLGLKAKPVASKIERNVEENDSVAPKSASITHSARKRRGQKL